MGAKLDTVTNADGSHAFTYDARGQLATETVAEGTYTYGYDTMGRLARIDYPDGHARVQVYDDLGRILSRCYVFDTSQHCYNASYDAVGNPTILADPDGTDTITYDNLDRVTSVTRVVSGATVASETYAYNALGALATNADVPMDHQRPRLDGGGLADAAVPNTLDSQPVTLDAGGRITSLDGVSFGWSARSYLLSATPPIPASPETYQVDAYMRRTVKYVGSSLAEAYEYEGPNRVATLDSTKALVDGYLFAGVDDPLRINHHGAVVFYETDLAGNVRHLRGAGNTDLGGYRYSAFGQLLEDTATSTLDQPLRWKGRPRSVLGGVETYDMRARQWVPKAGAFLSVDAYWAHDSSATLWAWPNQSPLRWSDPFGRSRAPAGFGGPTPLDVLAQDAFTNASDLADFATADYNSGNYVSAYFHGALAVDMVAIGIGAKALPFIVEAVAMTEGGECPTRTGRPTVGNNPRVGGGRTNTDLPGGRPVAKSIFRNASSGQDVTEGTMANGGVRRTAADGTQIRMNPDGSTRVDLPGNGPTGNETIHFDP